VAKSFLLKVTCSWDAARSAGVRDPDFGFVAASPPTNSHQFAERFLRFKASENTPHLIISSDEGSAPKRDRQSGLWRGRLILGITPL
jgi:hypothetical protein